jgi:hypothetical protein
VTTDVVLTRDLTCAGTALTVRLAKAGTVHIDLNGHQLRGNGTGYGITIDDRPASATVVVYRGTISGFAGALGNGSVRYPTNQITVDDVRLTSNGSWLARTFMRADILHSQIINSGTGGSYADSRYLTVADTRLVNSSIDATAETNINLYGDTFTGGSIHQDYASNFEAIGSTFINCGNAVSLMSPAYVRIRYNQFVHCASGLRIDIPQGSVDVTGNLFSGNSSDGFHFGSINAASPTPFSISDNLFVANQGDGLAGSGGTAITVSGNRAFANAGHGIDVTSVVDGGGNVARGNRTQPNCVGVVCPAS